MPHQHWSFGTNNLYYTAQITVSETPWKWFFLHCLVDKLAYVIPPISLPSFIKVTDGEEKISFNDYYGDLKGLYFAKILTPIFSKVYNDKTTDITYEVPFTSIEKNWPDAVYDYPEPDDLEQEYLDFKAKHRSSMIPIWNQYDDAIKRLRDQSNKNMKEYLNSE
jgi:hypothetical protein